MSELKITTWVMGGWYANGQTQNIKAIAPPLVVVEIEEEVEVDVEVEVEEAVEVEVEVEVEVVVCLKPSHRATDTNKRNPAITETKIIFLFMMVISRLSNFN